jgi:molybdate/tungstate transport system permease protein
LKRKKNLFSLLFYIAGGLIILFIMAPLVTVVLSTTPTMLWQSILDTEVFHSLTITLWSGFLATLIGLLCGVPMAFLLARNQFMGKSLIEGVVNLPMVIPHTAAGISLLMVFGRKGMLGQFFSPLGIFFTDNLAGIIVAMLFVSVPFLINSARQAFQAIDVEIEDAAAIDGANTAQTFFYVILPLTWRGITSGAMMMWARGISEFGAVAILAYNPKIMPVLIYERFVGYGLNLAQPVTLILIIAALLIFLLFRRFSRETESK